MPPTLGNPLASSPMLDQFSPEHRVLPLLWTQISHITSLSGLEPRVNHFVVGRFSKLVVLLGSSLHIILCQMVCSLGMRLSAVV